MTIRFVLKRKSPNNSTAADSTLAEHLFDGEMFTVGSDSANNLMLDESASEQLLVIREGDDLTLLNRAEGTRLNGENLRREAIQPLKIGDEIGIKNYIILIVEDALDLMDEVVAAANVTAPEIAVSPMPEVIAQNSESDPPTAPPSRNFADILDTLRTEEDSFYFVVSNGGGKNARIPLEQSEMPIGANGKGELAFAAEQISTLYAVARKDWSGILLESQRRKAVFVNDEAVETIRRLRNDDRVSFAAPTKCSLVLHEPSSLVALESLLSSRVAPNRSIRGENPAEINGAAKSLSAAQKISPFERRYFNHFSFIEVVTMIIGTLIGAVLFFLFFEFVFS